MRLQTRLNRLEACLGTQDGHDQEVAKWAPVFAAFRRALDPRGRLTDRLANARERLADVRRCIVMWEESYSWIRPQVLPKLETELAQLEQDIPTMEAKLNNLGGSIPDAVVQDADLELAKWFVHRCSSLGEKPSLAALWKINYQVA